MIPAVEIRRAESIIDRSGLVDELEALLRPVDPVSGRHIGRPRDISVRTFLVGVLLTAGHGKNLHLRQVHRNLTRDISRTQQARLGVRFERRGERLGSHKRVLTYNHFSRLLCAITRKVTATVDAEGDDASAAYLQSIIDRLIAASIAAGPAPSGHWAIDGSGVDTWANGLKSEKRRADRDAQWGYRTPTPQKSMSDKFFGYDLYGLTTVPLQRGDGSDHPNLIGRIVVRPAASDDAEASLTGIDSLLASGEPVERVLVDRGISYKADEKWASQLRDRGIEQTLDMHASEHGRLDYDGIAMIDGSPHCPCIPETLVYIKRPERLSVPTEPDDNPELEEFRDAMDERGHFAMRRTAGWTTKKRTGERVERFECPAEAGYLRCPLKPASMLFPDDIPLNLHPPDPASAPKCCTQRTIELPEAAQGKLRQTHRWGSDSWIKDYTRRTYVEGSFGELRNPALGALARGKFCIIGLIKVTLMLAALAAASNARRITTWATNQQVISDDPALAPVTDDDWAFEELGPDLNTGTDPPPATAPI